MSCTGKTLPQDLSPPPAQILRSSDCCRPARRPGLLFLSHMGRSGVPFHPIILLLSVVIFLKILFTRSLICFLKTMTRPIRTTMINITVFLRVRFVCRFVWESANHCLRNQESIIKGNHVFYRIGNHCECCYPCAYAYVKRRGLRAACAGTGRTHASPLFLTGDTFAFGMPVKALPASAVPYTGMRLRVPQSRALTCSSLPAG